MFWWRWEAKCGEGEDRGSGSEEEYDKDESDRGRSYERVQELFNHDPGDSQARRTWMRGEIKHDI